jgi:hypothetical protein
MPTTEKRALCRLPNAAYRRPSARILIVDNHDDFGRRARRNKFELRFARAQAYPSRQITMFVLIPAFFPSIRILHPLLCHRFDARTRAGSQMR